MLNRRYVAVIITASLGTTSLLLIIPKRVDTTWAAVGLAAVGWCIAVGLCIDLFCNRKETRQIVASTIQDGNLSTPPGYNAPTSSSQVAELRQGGVGIEIVVADQPNPLRSLPRESVDTQANHPPSSGKVWKQRSANISMAREEIRDDYGERSIESVQGSNPLFTQRNASEKD